MEQETILKEILHALKVHGEHMDKKFDQINRRFEEMDNKFEKRFEEMDAKFEEMDNKFEKRFEDMDNKFGKRFDRLGMKVDGIRAELTETQETTDFLLSKTARHEKKFRELADKHQY